MKTIITLLILLFAVDLSTAQEKLNLSNAIEAALEHNHNIQISKIEQDKASNLVTRGNAGQLPSLSVNSDLNWSYADLELSPGSFFQNLLNPESGEGRSPGAIKFDGVSSTIFSAGLGTQFVIYDGMKGRLRYRTLETGSDLAGLQHKQEMENTVLVITRNYVHTVTLQKAIELKELAMEQSRDRYRVVETRREYGQASEQQLLQALADLKADSTEYRDLIHQYENAYRDLHTAIGWDRREMLPLDDDILSTDLPHYDNLLYSMYENNTALNVRERRIEQAQIEQKITKADFFPTITAGAHYGYTYQSATDGLFETQEQLGFMGGISIKIPIFTGGRNRTASENAKASLRQEQIRYDDSEQQLRTQFDNTWNRLLYLENRLTTEQDNLAVYERNYERAKDSFGQGLITGVELRSAQLSLQDACLRISETDFQIKLTETTLLYLSGGLLISSQ
ncbi:MAG: TolC family protein [Balneolaceae bacterium]|nr:MAG: TolC family protein [Balneolaceae bacterium]